MGIARITEPGPGRPWVIAHRGARSNCPPGNTLEAFDEALRLGADAIEMDVRRLGCGTLVTHHDAEVGERSLASMNYGNARQRCLAAGYDLPKLDDVVRWAAGKIALDVELKEGGYEGRVLALLDQHMAPDEAVVKSFDHGVVRSCRAMAPHRRTGLLLGTGEPEGLATRLNEMFPAKWVSDLQPAFLGPHHSLVRRPRYVAEAHQRGLPVWVWTVNDAPTMRRMLAHGVDAIISDRPDLVFETMDTYTQELR